MRPGAGEEWECLQGPGVGTSADGWDLDSRVEGRGGSMTMSMEGTVQGAGPSGP